MPLVRLPSYDDMFQRGPVGHYAIGPQFLIWCSAPAVCGLVLWGQTQMTDLARLVEVFDHGEGTGIAVPCDFVVDARRLERVDPSVFAELVREAGPRLAHVARRLRRQAVVVRREEVAGAVMSGFYAMVGAQLTWRVVEDLPAALHWFELDAGGTVAREVDQLVSEHLAGSAVVDALRVWLRDRGLRAALGEAAAALGMSVRSLQRRLGEAGTSFRAEVDQACLALAYRRLIDSDDKVAAIAAEIGSSSESNFITFFRRLTGQTPAAWRAAQRG